MSLRTGTEDESPEGLELKPVQGGAVGYPGEEKGHREPSAPFLPWAPLPPPNAWPSGPLLLSAR